MHITSLTVKSQDLSVYNCRQEETAQCEGCLKRKEPGCEFFHIPAFLCLERIGKYGKTAGAPCFLEKTILHYKKEMEGIVYELSDQEPETAGGNQ